ncbi:hypothetical protein BDQ12DRAFT_180817 [Crucibulum laeve]|uniref:Amidohydrolase-related domain-containing protein n=1 Tax=Crucibulum laeve TaxID=68775 RepID=A0A5C3MDR1_9AGAR|nr:hypothetical protein BDQ12DRAFT_180817 [Crucibulum laeve]
MRRIDIHHHFFSPDICRLKEKSSNALGWRVPAESTHWSPQISKEAMDSSGIDVAILSFPAFSVGCISPENRTTARERNITMSNICQLYPERFTFWATMPFLDDVEGVLAEIAYALDTLHAVGISLSSCYGEGADTTFIGHEKYDPIWAELDRRGVVVFIHGTQTPSSTPYPDPFLGIPITEVPSETFKAAAHLVVTGKKRKYRNVKIVLAHLGGSTPFLAPRVAVLSRHMGCPLSENEITEDFKSFYYETALSASDTNLAAMDVFVGYEKLLFGTDFPAVSVEMADWYTNNLEKHYSEHPQKLEDVMCNNALKLFPRLQVDE